MVIGLVGGYVVWVGGHVGLGWWARKKRFAHPTAHSTATLRSPYMRFL